MRKFTMGGTAVTQFVENINGWVVAMSGDFDGGVFARIVGESRDLGHGRTEVDLEHHFVRKDGSTISTKDVGVLTAVPGNDRVLAATTYSVVNATGAFEGMTGSFKSWGSFDQTNGQGILRFWGELSEKLSQSKSVA